MMAPANIVRHCDQTRGKLSYVVYTERENRTDWGLKIKGRGVIAKRGPRKQ